MAKVLPLSDDGIWWQAPYAKVSTSLTWNGLCRYDLNIFLKNIFLTVLFDPGQIFRRLKIWSWPISWELLISSSCTSYTAEEDCSGCCLPTIQCSALYSFSAMIIQTCVSVFRQCSREKSAELVCRRSLTCGVQVYRTGHCLGNCSARKINP